MVLFRNIFRCHLVRYSYTKKYVIILHNVNSLFLLSILYILTKNKYLKSNIAENKQSLTLIFFIILVVPALFYQTTLAMAEVWWVNETFTHGFLIFPITLWLIWEKKDHLSKLYPAPEPLLLIITFLISCLWLISALIDVKVVMQLSMISMILTLVWVILGRKWVKNKGFG